MPSLKNAPIPSPAPDNQSDIVTCSQFYEIIKPDDARFIVAFARRKKEYKKLCKDLNDKPHEVCRQFDDAKAEADNAKDRWILTNAKFRVNYGCEGNVEYEFLYEFAEEAENGQKFENNRLGPRRLERGRRSKLNRKIRSWIKLQSNLGKCEDRGFELRADGFFHWEKQKQSDAPPDPNQIVQQRGDGAESSKETEFRGLIVVIEAEVHGKEALSESEQEYLFAALKDPDPESDSEPTASSSMAAQQHEDFGDNTPESNDIASARPFDVLAFGPNGFSARLFVRENDSPRNVVLWAVQAARGLEKKLRKDRRFKDRKTVVAIDLCPIVHLKKTVSDECWVGWPPGIERARALANHPTQEAENKRLADAIERGIICAEPSLKLKKALTSDDRKTIARNISEAFIAPIDAAERHVFQKLYSFRQAFASFQDESCVHVLITAPVERIVHHWCSCEPVGAIDGEAPNEVSVHRVWFCNNPDQEAVAVPARNLYEFDADTKEMLYAFRRVKFTVNSDEAGKIQALRAVRYFEELANKRSSGDQAKSVTLLWQCDKLRTFDLLAPVTESLRTLLDLPEYTKSSLVEWSTKHTTMKWLTHKYRRAKPAPDGKKKKSDDESGARRLVSLLTGTDNHSLFIDIVKVLRDFLLDISHKLRLQIVVENIQHADNRTRELWRLLNSVHRSVHDSERPWLRIVVVGIPESPPDDKFDIVLSADVADYEIKQHDQDVNLSLNNLARESSTFKLLKIASALGAAFPRYWLRKLWMATKPEDDAEESRKKEFNQALADALEKGILCYSGRLCAVDGKQPRYREIVFRSGQFREQIAREDHGPSQAEVARWFARLLPVNVRPGTEKSVHCKIRVCQMLDPIAGDLDEKQRSILWKLWHNVGDRAQNTGAHPDAVARWASAYNLIRRDLTQDSLPHVIKPAIEILTDRVATAGLDADSQSDALDFIEKYVPNDRKHKYENDLFALFRQCWEHEHRFGKLSIARRLAHDLDARSDRFKYDNLSRLEIAHISSVTYFSLGRLKDCLKFSLKGLELCLQTELGPHFTGSLCFASHDGGVCCKMFAALSFLLQGDPDHARELPQEWRQVLAGRKEEFAAESQASAADRLLTLAIDFAATREDPTSPLVARAYYRLFQILRAEFGVAVEPDGQLPKPLKSGSFKKKKINREWMLFDQMLTDCARIGEIWGSSYGKSLLRPGMLQLDEDQKKRLDNTVKVLVERRKEWSRNEYVSVWGTWQAVGQALKGENERARETFTEIKETAEARGEQFYLPELYRLWSWYLRGQNDSEAKQKLQKGLDLASQLNMKLFKDRLVLDQKAFEGELPKPANSKGRPLAKKD